MSVIVYGKTRSLRTSTASLAAVVSIFVLGVLTVAFGGAARGAHAEINRLTDLLVKEGERGVQRGRDGASAAAGGTRRGPGGHPYHSGVAGYPNWRPPRRPCR